MCLNSDEYKLTTSLLISFCPNSKDGMRLDFHLCQSLPLFPLLSNLMLSNSPLIMLLLLLVVTNWSNGDILKCEVNAMMRHCMDYVWFTSGPKDGRFGMQSGRSEYSSIFFV